MSAGSDPRPEVSIVVAAHQGPSALERCLAAVESEIASLPELAVETLVVAAGSETARAARSRANRSVRVIELPRTASVPELRGAGLREARGAVVALLEDHLRPAPGWLAALVSRHRRCPTTLAVGGAVDPVDTGRSVDWAAYFCEYGAHMGPLEPGPARSLTAANAAYKREALACFGDLAEWETLWHARLLERGHELLAEPSMVVLHERRFAPGEFLRQRIRYGRQYASIRSRHLSVFERAARAATFPLLPLVLATRLGRSVLTKRRHRAAFFRALPWTFLFLAAWAVGEAAGYCRPIRRSRQ
jgi:glycosyltransferase involved in cell wall biosynthesis